MNNQNTNSADSAPTFGGHIPGLYRLFAPGEDFKPAVTLGGNLPKTVSGQPAAYFWKDVIAPGQYHHPAKKFSLAVDPARLKRWAETGRKMLSAGVAIPINCDHSDAARDCVGYIKDFKVEGNRLMALCQFIGEDAPLLAARNQVSAGIMPEFTDGKGRRWGDAIVHVALTPVPVVPAQDGFVQAQETLMLAISPAPREIEAIEPAGGKPAKVDEAAHEAALELFDTKMDMALSRGALDIHTKERLMALLTHDAREDIHTLMFSRAAGSSARPLALAIAEILIENKPVPNGEATGLQAMTRLVPGEADLAALGDFSKYMTQVANRR